MKWAITTTDAGVFTPRAGYFAATMQALAQQGCRPEVFLDAGRVGQCTNFLRALHWGAQLEADVFTVGKCFEHGDAVIADGRQPQSLRSDLLPILFQLDQLGFAERSPVGRAIENQQSAFWAEDGTKRLDGPILVLQAECGNTFADVRSSRNCGV